MVDVEFGVFLFFVVDGEFDFVDWIVVWFFGYMIDDVVC